ncbi:hypothetical protein [Anthocerotibacter panamensis]|uniref:hypothetical protein n=1 Tax=Anthocerotibacter panamensis TaxID=2857077 RepID=UPI001C405C2B|nr:hypothetical protein [Anthocerotibacter panamensis]
MNHEHGRRDPAAQEDGDIVWEQSASEAGEYEGSVDLEAIHYEEIEVPEEPEISEEPDSTIQGK